MISNEIKRLLRGKKATQVGSLYSSLLFGIVTGIGVSVINTRLLGPQQFGDLKFLQTLFSFAPGLITLGIFVSGSRLLAQRSNEGIKQELIGSLLALAGLISMVLTVAFFASSFLVEEIFEEHLGQLIRIFSIFLFVYPVQLCLQRVMQGDNRIYELSALTKLPSILYIVGSMLLNLLTPMRLIHALSIQFLAGTVTVLLLTIQLKPKFAKIREHVQIIWDENKKYGFHVYVGILAGVATEHLGSLSIAYYLDNIRVGFFSLALTITMPLTLIPSPVGTTFFKDFANTSTIPKRATVLTICLSACSLFLFFLIIEKVIQILYSEQYIAVVPIAHLVAIGCVFHGFGDYVNRYLGAQGKGKQLRNGAIARGVCNVCGYTFLVNALGLTGAAITKTVSGVIYFGMMLFYYSKDRKERVAANCESLSYCFSRDHRESY